VGLICRTGCFIRRGIYSHGGGLGYLYNLKISKKNGIPGASCQIPESWLRRGCGISSVRAGCPRSQAGLLRSWRCGLYRTAQAAALRLRVIWNGLRSESRDRSEVVSRHEIIVGARRLLRPAWKRPSKRPGYFLVATVGAALAARFPPNRRSTYWSTKAMKSFTSVGPDRVVTCSPST